MTQPHPSPPGEDEPKGFSYQPGSIPPVTGVPYPGGTGFVTPQATPRRPGVVTAAVVLLWVLTGLTLLGVLLLTLLVLLAAVQPADNSPGTGLLGGVLAVVLLTGFAVLMVVAAIRLPKRADSARVTALTLMGFFVFSNLTYIVLTLGKFANPVVSTNALARDIVTVFASLLLAAMPATVIILLALKKTVTWFYERPSPEGENR